MVVLQILATVVGIGVAVVFLYGFLDSYSYQLTTAHPHRPYVILLAASVLLALADVPLANGLDALKLLALMLACVLGIWWCQRWARKQRELERRHGSGGPT